ncbi:MAG: hypothetical protein VX026_02050 [Myxococcota bacterium]|nr:hypothetical protein [Myxococcota bacterium]
MKKQTPIISGTLSALTGNLSILGVLIVCFALFDATIFQGLISFLGLNTSQQLITAGGINVQQSELIKLILGTMGVNLVGRIILFGPIFGAICVYIGRNHTENKNSSLYGGLNFALSRYKLLFVPNLLAQLAIQIGMIIIIPGVLSWMQFAFVEPVACLEEEKHVLSRSKRLTKGRRKSIFLIILPWIIFSQVFGIVELYAATVGFGATVAACMVMETLLVCMQLAFFMLYHNRMAILEAKIAARAKKKAEDEMKSIEESNAVDTDKKADN